jgi:hypothetical protein
MFCAFSSGDEFLYSSDRNHGFIRLALSRFNDFLTRKLTQSARADSESRDLYISHRNAPYTLIRPSMSFLMTSGNSQDISHCTSPFGSLRTPDPSEDILLCHENCLISVRTTCSPARSKGD